MFADKQIIEQIPEHLSLLLNQEAREFGRAGNMLWMCLGKDAQRTNYKGETRTVTEYALHIQCNWSIYAAEKILISFSDIWKPRTGLSTEEFNPDEIGGSRFEEIVTDINANIMKNHAVVTDFHVDTDGGFSLYLSNNFELTVSVKDLSASDEDIEYWRLLEGPEKNHFVVESK